MTIYPKINTFQKWAKMYKRVPLLSEKIIPPIDVALFFKQLFFDSKEAFLYESGKGCSQTSRYTLMGIPNSCYVKIEDKQSIIKLSKNLLEVIGSVDDGWQALNFKCDTPNYEHLNHFWGGWAGYISYEAGHAFEKLPKRKRNELGLPDAYFMQVDRVIVYDHHKSILKYIIATEYNNDSDYYQFIDEIDNVWDKIDSIISSNPIKKNSITLDNPSSNTIKSNISSNEYVNMVNKAKKYIYDGDIYQANIAQRFDTEFKGDQLELYLELRMLNPAPFSGFLRFLDFSIISSSPERLIKVQGDQLETRPIAGTRPRGLNIEKDTALTKDLFLNEKERAEHLMLVDLERSDMGRVCEDGSVLVTELMVLEQYSHVSHIVSNIIGKLKPNISVHDLLKALFPGGTITGCPKIRCMEIINELEPLDRGPYSGSFGYIGFSQQLDLNILIRTILVKDGKAYFHVGAGIVADSNPDNEYAETLSKAAAMIEVLLDKSSEC